MRARAVERNILPAESEQLTFTGAGCRGEGEQCPRHSRFSRLDKLADLTGIKNFIGSNGAIVAPIVVRPMVGALKPLIISRSRR